MYALNQTTFTHIFCGNSCIRRHLPSGPAGRSRPPTHTRIVAPRGRASARRRNPSTHLDGPHPGLDCSMRPMAMAHDTVAAIRQFQILSHRDKAIGLGDQHLSQHSAGAFSCKFAQRVVNRLRLTQRDDNAISRHGVSLLSGGSGRLDSRLDTPPSINRRHPDCCLAHRRRN